MNESTSIDGIYYEEIDAYINHPTIHVQAIKADVSIAESVNINTYNTNSDTNEPDIGNTPTCGQGFINAIATMMYLCYWICIRG